MNTELQAMIDAGRKLIAEQAAAEQRKAAEAAAEAERLESIHLAKLPAWMHEYVDHLASSAGAGRYQRRPGSGTT